MVVDDPSDLRVCFQYVPIVLLFILASCQSEPNSEQMCFVKNEFFPNTINQCISRDEDFFTKMQLEKLLVRALIRILTLTINNVGYYVLKWELHSRKKGIMSS